MFLALHNQSPRICIAGTERITMDDGYRTVSGQTLINRKTLLAMIPLSDRAIFNMEKRGDFPRRIVLTSRNVAWDLTEVEDWIEARKRAEDQAHHPGFTAASR
jgi:prophage regulatory protein